MMNPHLPDISHSQSPSYKGSIAWVGMQGIDLPLTLQQGQINTPIQCKINAMVNLPQADMKGIHMSRLYQCCNQLKCLTTRNLHQLLHDMLITHQDCGSSAARFDCQFELLLQRTALLSSDLSGWKAYPVHLCATSINGQFNLELQIDVTYSSTCPCSAALSRQVIADAFLNDFAQQTQFTAQQVSQWLASHASLATPHSQRSVAQITIRQSTCVDDLDLIQLIDLIEERLQTATQTAVKRIDEQAFAQRNGENLMFVEDAIRRLSDAIAAHYVDWSIKVDHQESLHPHNAVAYQYSDNWLAHIEV